MSFASVGALGTATENTSDTSLVITTTATLESGNLGVVLIAVDNFNTTDADHSEIASVADSAGNTWEKIKEYTNGQGGGGSGATVSVWACRVPVQLPSGGTITITLANARTGKAASAWEFTMTATDFAIGGSNQDAGDAVDPAAISLSSLPSRNYLLIHAIAIESVALTYTQDADYTTITSATGGGAGAAGMGIYGGFRIATLTSDTVDVATSVGRDHAQVLIALYEVFPPTIYVGATIRFLVGDRFGRVLAELNPDLAPISWRMNDVGQANFQIAASDPKATEELLRFGNRVYIDLDNGLPAWGGVIDPPRGWAPDGRISVSVYSGERLLSWRRTLRTRAFNGMTAGEIFQALVQEANGPEDLGIVLGDVWTGGEPYTLELHYADVLDVIRGELCGSLSSAEFALLPILENGRISFKAELYERRGADKPNVVLIEGHNLFDEGLTENGPIVNDWALAGSGSNWGEDRLTSEGGESNVDPTSIGEFGLRQDAAVHGDVTVQSTLDAQSATLLANSKSPRKLTAGYAANLAPAAFADYDLGDRIRVQLHSKGFGGTDTTIRVVTREFDPATGLCLLVPEQETA